jgi:hypothetical protein
MIHDSGYHGRRVQSQHGNLAIMIRGVQLQYDGFSWKLAWDLGTVVFDRSITDIDEMTNFHFLEFNFGIHRIVFLEEWSFEELIDFMQLMISWFIKGSKVDSFVSTL